MENSKKDLDLEKIAKSKIINAKTLSMSFNEIASLIESGEISFSTENVEYDPSLNSLHLEKAICGFPMLGLYVQDVETPFILNWDKSIERAIAICSFLKPELVGLDEPFRLFGLYCSQLDGVAFDDFSLHDRLAIKRTQIQVIFVKGAA